ncbi:hypothetical protein LG632_29475, partial [Streptomyces sp. SMC 277]|nr:hypothetical protein [Streptomyces antimicrobicus]
MTEYPTSHEGPQPKPAAAGGSALFASGEGRDDQGHGKALAPTAGSAAIPAARRGESRASGPAPEDHEARGPHDTDRDSAAAR